MDLKTAAQHGINGEALLFLGAGFSRSAINIQDQKFCTSKEFADELNTSLSLPAGTPLTLATEVFRDNHGTEALIDLVKPRFTSKTPVAPEYATIAKLPWRRTYTTNYDDLFEKASESAGIPIFSTTLSDRVRDIPKDKRCCVHLNGYVARLNRSTVDSELKLTDSSYVTGSILDSEWAILLRHDLRLCKAVVFVGYSLYDLEIRKLLLDIPIIQSKALFLLGPSPNTLLQQQIQRYGSTLPLSAQDLAYVINQLGSKPNRLPEEAQSLVTLDKFNPPDESVAPTDANVWALLLQGVISPPNIQFALNNKDSFVLRRTKMKHIIKHLDENKRVFTLLGELGNGKTLFLQTFQFELHAAGWEVFWIREDGEEAQREISRISAQPGKKVFFLENYPDRLPLIETFAIHAHSESALILTARTSVHDIFSDKLREMLEKVSVVEVRLDVLDENEIEWFLRFFNRYGMWGEKAGSPERIKTRILREDCDGQIHAILIKLLESPDIQRRLQELLSPLTANESYSEILTCIMIVSILGHSLSVDLLEDIVGGQIFAGDVFRTEPRIRQLVGFDSYTVNIRSSTVAHFYLTKMAQKSVTLEVLRKLATRANKHRAGNPFFRVLFESLQRFAIVQRLFPHEGKLAIVLTYYENIKELDGCTHNFHFWLQYAIAALTVGESERSKKYFDQAYSIARQKGIEAYQVDNHYCRYLLETAVEFPDAKEAMECFRRARDIINRQIRDERLHYPYRVAINYTRFINRFGPKLKVAWVDEIEQAARSVADRIPELPEDRRSNRYVRECDKEMDYVLYKCGDLKRRLGQAPVVGK
ncbi:MAG TPA: SIR2 family protein [Verrucomicrobiae bacterium]